MFKRLEGAHWLSRLQNSRSLMILREQILAIGSDAFLVVVSRDMIVLRIDE